METRVYRPLDRDRAVYAPELDPGGRIPAFDAHDESSVWALFGKSMRRLTPSIHASLTAQARRHGTVKVYGIPGGSIVDLFEAYDLRHGLGPHLDEFAVHGDGTITHRTYNDDDPLLVARPNGPYIDLIITEESYFEPLYLLVESLGSDDGPAPRRTTALPPLID